MKKPAKFNLVKASAFPEPLKNAGPEREACKLCKLYRGAERCKRPDIVKGLWTGRIALVVAGNETVQEMRLLRKQWRAAGWKDEDIAEVAAVRCPIKSEPSMKQIRACRPFLLKVLHALHPEHIIAVGNVAMRALRNKGDKNIIKNRGRDHDIPCDVPPESSAGGRVLS